MIIKTVTRNKNYLWNRVCLIKLYCIRVYHYMNQSIHLILIFTVSQSWLLSQQQVDEYITTYSKIAIDEMNRTGIPASIKLAQGLLESNIGASPLCTEANNHFGIKCGNQWTGKEMYREDDDYGVNGTLTKSCFRVFDSALDSYIAHSEFIMNPAKEFRYGFLFSIPVSDYSSWAFGLQSAGYATDPEYGNKLIRIISKYELYQYDGGHFQDGLSIAKSIVKKTIQFFHLVQEGETIKSIAAQYNINPSRLDQTNRYGLSNPIQQGTELMWNAYLSSENESLDNLSDHD